jgi:hypothetical protein
VLATPRRWAILPTGIIRLTPLSRWFVAAPLVLLAIGAWFSWMLRRSPLPGRLEPVGPGRSAAAPEMLLNDRHEYLLNAPAGGQGAVLLRFARTAAFARGRVTMTAEPQGGSIAAVGRLQGRAVFLAPLSEGSSHEVPADGYILWQRAGETRWPASLTEVEVKVNYAGYQWEPAERDTDSE